MTVLGTCHSFNCCHKNLRQRQHNGGELGFDHSYQFTVLVQNTESFQRGFLPFWQIGKQGQAIAWKADTGHQCLLANPGVPKVPCSHGTSWKAGVPTQGPVEGFTLEPQ